MNLRLEAILKKEKNLYKDITDELKGNKFAKLNSGLAKTIAMLLERKQLIEQLNKEALEDAEREALYQSIEDNNKYFAEVDRDDINNQFMQADDSYAKSAEWQNLHMAFLSTASVSSYKAVDKFNDDFDNLKKRKNEIDAALERTNKSKAKAMAADPTTTVDNAKAQWEKYKDERDKLRDEFKPKQKAIDKIQLDNQSATKKYLSSKGYYEEAKLALESLPNLAEDMKNDPEGKKFLPPEYFDKHIEKQKDILKKNEEARATAIANASAECKRYFEATYTKEEAEKLEYLEGFKKYLDAFAQNDSNVIKDICGTRVFRANESNLKDIVSTLGKYIKPDQPDYKKTKAAYDELYAMLERFDELHHEFDPEHYKGEFYKVENVGAFRPAKASEIVGQMIKQINNQLDKRKEEIFNNLSEKEKDLISPSEETKKAEKDINDKIEKLEAAKNKAIEARKSEAKFNKDFNTFINRKIKEGGYKIPPIKGADLEKVKGDVWLKTSLKSTLEKYKGLMEQNEPVYNKVTKALDEFAPVKAEYDKKYSDLSKKVEHAKQMMDPKRYFEFDYHKDALNKNCPDAPKLDVKAVMEEKRVSGFDLYQMAEAYKGNHKDSPEFAAMKSSMAYVMNWGTDYAIPPTYPNAPKTFEEAITQLKENCKKYVDAKNDQKRPFPSKMRHLRFQIAKVFYMYADTQKESLKDFKTSEKVANSWNDYFASRGETPILDEENKDLVKENNQIKEPVLEKEDELGGF